MRFHIRGMLENRTPVILKIDATDPYAAVTEARRLLIEDGTINPSAIQTLKVRKLSSAKNSSVYIGKPVSGKKRGPKTATTPATPAASPPAAPAANKAAPTKK